MSNLIFTIGYREHYDKYFRDSIPEDKVPVKLGRGGGYQGGCVWRTSEEAQKYLDDRNMHDYSVYGVEADWDKDTEPSNAPFNNLIRNAILVELKC